MKVWVLQEWTISHQADIIGIYACQRSCEDDRYNLESVAHKDKIDIEYTVTEHEVCT